MPSSAAAVTSTAAALAVFFAMVPDMVCFEGCRRKVYSLLLA
jgi:hypothetical protein